MRALRANLKLKRKHRAPLAGLLVLRESKVSLRPVVFACRRLGAR
jgi:hypothetical protein